jgi:hypothetical protein
MSGEPLDLRSLAQVDEPDVVRDALKTFRRRVLTRYIWISLAVGLVVAAVVWGLQPTTLEQRVQTATPVDEPQYVWHEAGLGIGLVRVAKLGDDVGMQFVVIPNAGGQAADGFDLSVAGSIETQLTSDGFNAYVDVPRTTDGRYVVTVQSKTFRAPRVSFAVSLSDLHVYPGIWKEEG